MFFSFVESPEVESGRFSLPLFLALECDFDFDRVTDRLEADGRDFKGVMTGLCLLMFPALSRLLDDGSLAAELKELYRKQRPSVSDFIF